MVEKIEGGFMDINNIDEKWANRIRNIIYDNNNYEKFLSSKIKETIVIMLLRHKNDNTLTKDLMFRGSDTIMIRKIDKYGTVTNMFKTAVYTDLNNLTDLIVLNGEEYIISYILRLSVKNWKRFLGINTESV